MSLTITLGWWLAPLTLAIAAFTWALWPHASDLGGFFPSFYPVIRFVAALIVSLLGLLAYLTWGLDA